MLAGEPSHILEKNSFKPLLMTGNQPEKQDYSKTWKKTTKIPSLNLVLTKTESASLTTKCPEGQSCLCGSHVTCE